MQRIMNDARIAEVSVILNGNWSSGVTGRQCGTTFGGDLYMHEVPGITVAEVDSQQSSQNAHIAITCRVFRLARAVSKLRTVCAAAYWSYQQQQEQQQCILGRSPLFSVYFICGPF